MTASPSPEAVERRTPEERAERWLRAERLWCQKTCPPEKSCRCRENRTTLTAVIHEAATAAVLAARASLASPPEGWRPIESYPHGTSSRQGDWLERGPRVLLWVPAWSMPVLGVGLRDWTGDVAFEAERGLSVCCRPTHWMPLPEAPETARRAASQTGSDLSGEAPSGLRPSDCDPSRGEPEQ